MSALAFILYFDGSFIDRDKPTQVKQPSPLVKARLGATIMVPQDSDSSWLESELLCIVAHCR